ncbi:Myb-like_DNA-binding domain-containing protein [Hexamita inflata]|uniref:Myb-like DNA-binding domain-containing protein n=1 Tax=Hexamita inflata TaxID=28002 RepID=A0AA86TJL6_9EUKA|nr:Myb-like DNA-binding domain-containing protein [Hexamita inflata]
MRIDWKQISMKIGNRTTLQCKLQYRNVLNKQRQKINYKWTAEEEIQLQLLGFMFGTKWNFIQQNYYPQLRPEQLQMKYHQINLRRLIYEEITSNPDKYKILNQNQIQALKYALERIDIIRQKLQRLNQNTPDLLSFDPLELQFYKMNMTDEYIQQMYKNEAFIKQLLNQQPNIHIMNSQTFDNIKQSK